MQENVKQNQPNYLAFPKVKLILSIIFLVKYKIFEFFSKNNIFSRKQFFILEFSHNEKNISICVLSLGQQLCQGCITAIPKKSICLIMYAAITKLLLPIRVCKRFAPRTLDKMIQDIFLNL